MIPYFLIINPVNSNSVNLDGVVFFVCLCVLVVLNALIVFCRNLYVFTKLRFLPLFIKLVGFDSWMELSLLSK